MGILKNDVGRPSNETLKTRRILKGLIVIVVVALIFFGGYMLSGITENNNKEENNKTNNKVEQTTSIKQDEFEILAQEILDNFVYDDYNLLATENFSEDYRTILAIKQSKKLSITDSCKNLFGNKLKKEYEMYIIENPKNNTEAYCFDSGEKAFYSYDEVNEKYKELFGSDANAAKTFVTTRETGKAVIYKYSDSNNGYVELSCNCGGIWYGEVHTIKEVSMVDNKLHIVFSYFNYGELGENGKIRLSDGNESLNIEVGNFKLDDFTNENYVKNEEKLKYIFDEYESKLPKYEIVFEKENDNYILHAMYKKN